jgi:hypothetical protein
MVAELFACFEVAVMVRLGIFALLLAVSFLPQPLRAAVFVLTNGTNESQRFTLSTDGGATKSIQLSPGETRSFACDESGAVTFRGKSQDQTVKLDAYTIYAFSSRNGVLDLQGVKLEGNAPANEKLPTAAFSTKTVTIPVKLLADDAERRPQTIWEPNLKKRFNEAATVVREATGVSFEVTAVSTWESDPNAADWKSQLADFERTVKPASGGVAVGYTSRKFAKVPGEMFPKHPGYAASVQTLQPHILVRESEPRTEPERVEVLVQQLGRYLGGIASPDVKSAMRNRLGDGQANQTRFRIGFDPLNLLAMNLTADDLRTGKVKRLNDLSSGTQARLGRIYATVLTAMPDEQLPDLYLAMLDRAGVQPPEGITPAGGIPKPRTAPKIAGTRNAKEEAVRSVVKAVTAIADANSKLPATGTTPRVKGDALTVAYLQEAAKAALQVEKEYRETAFLVGVGLALDDSTVLRDNPLTGALCKSIETEEERRQRIAVLGNPTLRYRRDLCQHFFVSAALTDLVGAVGAEGAGLAKEYLDMSNGGSGFSFTDLCADMAGVEFAKRVKSEAKELDTVQAKFDVDHYMPKLEGLRDGIPASKFKSEFGSVSDPKFLKAYAEIRKRVQDLPAYGKPKAE